MTRPHILVCGVQHSLDSVAFKHREQRSELVRVMSQEPGVSVATWKGGNGAWPMILEGALIAIGGRLFGALLAYLFEAHRRYNAQWSW